MSSSTEGQGKPLVAVGYMALAAFIGAGAQLLMKVAGNLFGLDGSELYGAGLFVLVFGMYGIVMVLFLQGLKHGKELSTTYPVYSLTFPMAAIMSGVFFGEQLQVLQWVGMVLICAGIGVMNLPERIGLQQRQP